MRKLTRGGFSLLEIVIVVLVMTSLAALAVGSFSGQRQRATSEGLARVLAADLEAARTKALKNGSPVAICFPSDGGTTPLSQGYYLLEGEVKPTSTRIQSWSGDFPGCVIASVHWGLPQPPTSAEDIEVARSTSAWLRDSAGQDYALIFLPDGSVTSNDLPQTDGFCRVLVASGLDVGPPLLSGTTFFSPTPNQFSLTKAFAPQTILISKAGKIERIPGVVDPSGVEILTAEPTNSLTIASLSPAPTGTDTLPALRTVEVAPAPFLEPKATVQKERNLSLKVTATDPDGDQLFCSWAATPEGTSSGNGSFSLSSNHEMLWDRKSEQWVSDCVWAPPSECKVGDSYTLTCTITDSDGNEVKSTEDILSPVTIIPPGKIVFDQNTNGAWGVSIVNTDGTGLRDLTNTGSQAAVSPDGTQIAWSNSEDGTHNQIWVMNIDGTGKRALSTFGGSKSGLTWSSDGRYILFSNAAIPGRDTIWAMRADGSGGGGIYSGSGSSIYSPVFSPDGRFVIQKVNRGAPGVPQVSGDLVIAEFVDPGGVPSLQDSSFVTDSSATRTMDNFVTWIPGAPGEFFYSRATPGPSGNYSDAIRETVRARVLDSGVSGTSRFSIEEIDLVSGDEFRVPPYHTMKPVFSPSGDRVVYGQYPSGLFMGKWVDSGTARFRPTDVQPMSPRTGGIQTVKAWVP